MPDAAVTPEDRASAFRVAIHRFLGAMDEMSRTCRDLVEADGLDAADAAVDTLPPALRSMFRLMLDVGVELPRECGDSVQAALDEARRAPQAQGTQRED